MQKKKYPRNLAFLFLLALILYKILILRPAIGAGSVGSLYIEPSALNSPVNQPFSVTVGVNVGTSLKVNVVNFHLSTSNAIIEKCTIGNGFQGIAGQNPCTISGSAATIVASAINTDGPSGAVTLAQLTLRGIASGNATLNSSTPQIAVKQSDGQSVFFHFTSIDTGNYQIGGSATLSPTIAEPCTIVPKSSGDANDDCVIDNADFDLWLTEFTGIESTLDADFNESGVVDLVDYEIWRRNKQ